jgi:DNA polymerase bacteriophage-type
MKYIVPDFETVSFMDQDLKEVGAWRYAEDPTTEVIVLRWSWSDKDTVGLWVPGMPVAQEIYDAVADGYLLTPHNAGFEKAIWRKIMVPVYGWPDVPNKFWDDSMARCANLCLPQDLDMATRILRLPATKDTTASKLVIGLSNPDKKGKFPVITPDVLALASEYCADDCRAQKGLRERVGTLSQAERQVWLLDQRINERGFLLDLELVQKMQEVVDGASEPLLKEFQNITGGLKIGSIKLRDWCDAQGCSVPNLQKETVARLLGASVDGEEIDERDEGTEATTDIPRTVRRALTIKQLIGSAAIKKLGRARAVVNADGRARGQLQYHGASPGLWAGRLLQPHNFPRGTITAIKNEKSEDFVARKVDALLTGDYKYVEAMVGPAVETVVSSLRHIIVPSPGRELVVGDFAGIQARIALAAAGQDDKTALMASGADVYIDMACDIFNMPKPDWSLGKEALKPWVSEFKEQHNERRQTGKNSILGLGFQMGWAKFRLRYCKDQPPEFAKRVVDTYRKEWAPKVPDLWYGLEGAARDTVLYRTPHEAFGVLFQLEDQWLSARLPSGRKLFYFNPQPARKVMPWSSSDAPDVRRSWTFNVRKSGRWATVDAFGGLLTENLASGLARDLLVAAMFKCEKNGLPIVLTVHDEIICDAEPRVDNAKVLKQIMEDRPQWAKDMQIPVEAETWSGPRYKK